MIEKLTKQLQSLAEELQGLERQFVAKKEQFLKVQGALEALVELSKEEEYILEGLYNPSFFSGIYRCPNNYHFAFDDLP